MFAAAIFTLTLAVFATAFPTKRAPAQVITKCTVPNTAALTFDDGPHVYLYDVSKALVAAGAKGTFFFNGNNYGCIYTEDNAKRVKYAYDKGHQVASHTWSHAHLTNLTWDQLHDEFWRVEQALARITGVVPAFARPPYGEYNDLVREVASVRGQTLVNWDFDSGDSVGKTAAESNKAYDDLAKAHPSTILALNHEVYQQTAQVVVPHAIATLQKAGYKLVTVAECLGRPAYQSVGPPAIRDASWTC
jgi:peptidoglycan/xylan/chitin deacetylase (PgdA/CDA1 family)